MSVVCPLTAALIAHAFLLSHMTCKKCKYEFCWVCMGRGSVMDVFMWSLIVRCDYI